MSEPELNDIWAAEVVKLRDERDRLRANLINCSERLAAYYGDNYPAVVDARAALTPAGQRWTRRKPTEPGWYWFRDNKKDPPDVHWLSLIDGKLRVFTMSNENCVEHIDDYTGEFQGPLTPNEATA